MTYQEYRRQQWKARAEKIHRERDGQEFGAAADAAFERTLRRRYTNLRRTN